MDPEEERARILVDTIAESSEVYYRNRKLIRIGGVLGGLLASSGFIFEQFNADTVDPLSATAIVTGVVAFVASGAMDIVNQTRYERRIDTVN